MLISHSNYIMSNYSHTLLTSNRVEIDAKIASGYFSSSQALTNDDLAKVKGRDWEDIEH
jgi:hypothetical protein